MSRQVYVAAGRGTEVRIILGDDAPPPSPAPVAVPLRRGKAPRGRERLFRRVRKWMRIHRVETFLDALYALAEVGLDAQSKESPKA